MGTESVVIGDNKYYINQILDEYGCDEIGNYYHLGLDYQEATLLRPKVSEDGEFWFEHNGNRMKEDVFICLCFHEYDRKNIPLKVIHLDGDEFNNSPDNLQFSGDV